MVVTLQPARFSDKPLDLWNNIDRVSVKNCFSWSSILMSNPLISDFLCSFCHSYHLTSASVRFKDGIPCQKSNIISFNSDMGDSIY